VCSSDLIDTDFGFRLTQRGRLRYVPSAIVYHYPRTTWGGFFRQQAGFARGAFWVYLRHTGQLRGDRISTFGMIWQVPLFILACLCLLLAPLARPFLWAALSFFLALLLVYARDILRLPVRPRHYPAMLAMFLVRTAGWAAGGLRGFLSFLSAPHRLGDREVLW
jgi:GT2 family glycosyltransferase